MIIVSFRYVEFSTLLQKHYNKIQETEQCNLKLCGYTYHQGTYTPSWGVSTLLQKHYNKIQGTEECDLKLCGYTYLQGTYTPLWGVRYELELQELQIISLLKRHSRGFTQK
jgi:ribosomal protein L37AE/L43A